MHTLSKLQTEYVLDTSYHSSCQIQLVYKNQGTDHDLKTVFTVHAYMLYMHDTICRVNNLQVTDYLLFEFSIEVCSDYPPITPLRHVRKECPHHRMCLLLILPPAYDFVSEQ